MKTFTITITDQDADKLAIIMQEYAEYQPAYFGSLAATVLSQLSKQEDKGETTRVDTVRERQPATGRDTGRDADGSVGEGEQYI